MNKLYTAVFIILAFATYASVHAVQDSTAIAQADTASVQTPTVTAPQETPTPAAPAQSPIPTQTTPIAEAPAPTKKGIYTDGTYTGISADAFYGSVQVQATISGGRLTAITFLSYPQDRNASRAINQSAMSALVNQAISIQSAQVSGVSGATDTVSAFRQSLSSALAQAA